MLEWKILTKCTLLLKKTSQEIYVDRPGMLLNADEQNSFSPADSASIALCQHCV